MVTYEGLFAFCLVLLGVAEQIFQFYNKKKSPPKPSKLSGYFLITLCKATVYR